MSGISSNANPGSLKCPNVPPDAGAVLFGIVQNDGHVAYISPTIPVTATLINEWDVKGIPAENRLRFSGPCMLDRCAWWKTDRCSLADAAVEYFNQDGTDNSAPPHCGIRAGCRWFAQHRQAACGGCPRVIRKPAVLYQGKQEE